MTEQELEADISGVDITETAVGAAIGFGTIVVLKRAFSKDDTGGTNGDGTDGSDGSGGDTGGDGTNGTDGDTMSDEKLEELISIQERQHGGKESIDAFASDQLDIPAGGTATVTITPRQGFTMFVKKSYFDRRADVNYTHHADGTQISDNHQAILRSARKVRYGGKVVGEAVNNGTSLVNIDYEFEGWATQSEKV